MLLQREPSGYPMVSTSMRSPLPETLSTTRLILRCLEISPPLVLSTGPPTPAPAHNMAVPIPSLIRRLYYIKDELEHMPEEYRRTEANPILYREPLDGMRQSPDGHAGGLDFRRCPSMVWWGMSPPCLFTRGSVKFNSFLQFNIRSIMKPINEGFETKVNSWLEDVKVGINTVELNTCKQVSTNPKILGTLWNMLRERRAGDPKSRADHAH